jgi:hypothetical protein
LLLAKIHPDVAQSNTATPTPGATPTPFTPPVFMLVAQANESGGSTLTQTSLFGSRIFYSGGAADTFDLYDVWGQPLCGGTTISYRGFIAVDRISTVMLGQPVDKYPNPATVGIQGSCLPAKPSQYLPLK